MALLNVTSPHTHNPRNTTRRFMGDVLLATLPALAIMTWQFGWGTLIQVFWAAFLAVLIEAAMLKIRGRDIRFYLSDLSAVVTGVLLALAIPPAAPWWLTLVGILFAMAFTKHLYGGLGMNPFNPAMMAYVLLLISFPQEMTRWNTPLALASTPGFSDSLHAIFASGSVVIDQFTGPTPLDSFKTMTKSGFSEDHYPILSGVLAGQGWEWVNLAFLAGGLYLLARKVITWHIPASLLLGLTLMSALTCLFADHAASPLFHLLSGGTMLGAFFIATDPVTAATSNRGKLVYGFLIGVLVYIIRTWGGYPDAIAFSVLLMNLAAPTIDYYTQPRTYGHQKPNRGLPKS